MDPLVIRTWYPLEGWSEGAVHMTSTVLRPVCSAVTSVGGGPATSGKLLLYQEKSRVYTLWSGYRAGTSSLYFTLTVPVTAQVSNKPVFKVQTRNDLVKFPSQKRWREKRALVETQIWASDNQQASISYAPTHHSIPSQLLGVAKI